MSNEAGMFASTRCKFCGEFFEKAVPFVCPHCWEMVQEYVNAALAAKPKPKRRMRKNQTASPTPEWKPGQMLIRKDGRICKLGQLVCNLSWTFTYWDWDTSKWADGIIVGKTYFDGAEPYPRVGDWVRERGKLPFVIRRFERDVAYGNAADDLGRASLIADLEPSSPPCPHDSYHELTRDNSIVCPKCNEIIAPPTLPPPKENTLELCPDRQWNINKHAYECPECKVLEGSHAPSCKFYKSTCPPREQPKPTLEGPHWEKMRSGEMLKFGDKAIQKCFEDLWKAVKELQKSHYKTKEKT